MNSFNKVWIFPLVWWMAWIIFHAWYLVYSGWDRDLAIIESITTNLILAAICSGVLFSVQYNRPNLKTVVVLFTGILLSCVFWLWLSDQILTELLSGEQSYLDFFRGTASIRFLIGFFMITMFGLLGWLSLYIREQVEEKNRANELLKLSRESELVHLRRQLQPHFLFNTLNSVSALIGSNPPAAKKMILQLSDFLRSTLKKEDHKLVALSEELEYLNLYLEIEKVRFGNRLGTVTNVSPGTATEKIPEFLLQPLVENAIKFGLYDTLEPVQIEINASKEEHFLVITISNPFDPATTAAATGTGFGLTGVSRRLFLLYNRTDLIVAKPTGNLFTVMIKIPLAYV